MDWQKEFPKKTLFWKHMITALQAMYQEYDLYERLAKDRQFDMSKHLKKTMDRFYQAAATGYQPDEKYLLAVEQSYFEPLDGYEELALQIVKDLEDFFHVVYEKDCKKAAAFLERPFRLLEQFYELSSNIDVGQAKEEEQKYLVQLIEEAVAVDKAGKKDYIEMVKSRERPRLIGEELLENRAPVKKEKPIRKVFPLIRRTSLRYDYDLEQSRKYPKENNPYQINENWEDIQTQWYLNALETLYDLEMFEYGCPRKNRSHRGGYLPEGTVEAAMVKAYAAGAKELIPKLFYFSYDKSGRALYELLCGNGTKEQYVNEDMEGHFYEGVLAIFDRDGAALTKALLKRVRYVRGWYELYRITADEWGCALVRLAREAGLEYEKVIAVEILDCEVHQPDLSRLRLNDQEEKDRWLAEASKKHFKLDKVFPYIPQGQTKRRPDTSLDTIAYLMGRGQILMLERIVHSTEKDGEAYQLCMNFDYQGLYEYADRLIQDGDYIYQGYILRAYAHMQLYREQYDWKQVYADLSKAIAYSSKTNIYAWVEKNVMAVRSRVLVNPDKESLQYQQDIAYLQEKDEYMGWYYK